MREWASQFISNTYPSSKNSSIFWRPLIFLCLVVHPVTLQFISGVSIFSLTEHSIGWKQIVIICKGYNGYQQLCFVLSAFDKVGYDLDTRIPSNSSRICHHKSPVRLKDFPTSGKRKSLKVNVYEKFIYAQQIKIKIPQHSPIRSLGYIVGYHRTITMNQMPG